MVEHEGVDSDVVPRASHHLLHRSLDEPSALSDPGVVGAVFCPVIGSWLPVRDQDDLLVRPTLSRQHLSGLFEYFLEVRATSELHPVSIEQHMGLQW